MEQLPQQVNQKTHITSSHVMLSIRFDPVQPQSVQKRGQTFHDTQDTDRTAKPYRKHDEQEDGTRDEPAVKVKRKLEGHGPEHL